jgi:hypothetical protein
MEVPAHSGTLSAASDAAMKVLAASDQPKDRQQASFDASPRGAS